MKLLAAVLGDQVDLRSALETVLRRIGVRLDVDFGDRIDAGDAAEIAAAAAIAAVHAVGVDRVAAAALERRHGRLVAVTPGIAVRNQR